MTMWTLLFVVFATGSPAILQAAPVQGNSGRCSFAGVFHIEGISRYSLTFQKAGELCQSLGYRLATQEQVTEAYRKGLRTCRYGWIDGQNVTFLPHFNGPNCDSSSAEFTFHAKAAEFLSDVYCFDPSDSSPNCEYAVKSEDFMNGNAPRDISFYEKPHDDILTEFKTEGFLVDVEEISERVKRETSLLSDMIPSTVPSMKNNEDIKDPTSKPHFGKTPSVLLFDPEGSGSGLIDTEPSHFTTSPITTKTATSYFNENDIEKDPAVVPVNALNVNREGVKNNFARHLDLPSTPQSQVEGSSSTWMIITAFCVVIGVIVCIFVAIGTRDKWYGPSKSADITTEKNNKDYSKTETLPLSEKEQEIVALMNVTSMKNGQTVDITATDEHEKEYLM